MFRRACSLAAAAALTPADAFSYTQMIRSRQVGTLLAFQSQEQYQLQELYQPPHPAETGTLDRAVDCANNFGLCDIEEILDLSDELDAYMGCFVEDGPEACENEINERKHLADALLMQGEIIGQQQQLEQPPFDGEGPFGGEGPQGQFFMEEEVYGGPQGRFIEEGAYASYEQPMQNNFGSPIPPASSPPRVGKSGSVRNPGDAAGVSDFLPQDFAMAPDSFRSQQPDSFRGSQSHVTTKESHNGNF